ncbi:DUF305 domain-containing protein [Streptosporangium sp. NPDC023615]|uniref:DUF305 domain-containing protein n=1 Tax=Streptosporangium sp. NPDC023615 TaxID=3154794 RepID=UPI0034303CDA
MKRAVPAVVLGVLLLSGCGGHDVQGLRGASGHGAHGASAPDASAPAAPGTSGASAPGASGAETHDGHDAPGTGRGVPRPSPEPPVGTAAGVAFNAQDVMFLQMMVPHNTQVVELVRLVRERRVRPEVRELAEAIGVTQERESASMSALLTAWAQPATARDDEHAAHGGMPGVSEEEIEALTAAPEAEFERRFLDMMIAQQDDASQMAKVEVATGLHPGVTELAGRIDVSRGAQIARMLALRGR